MSSLRNAVQRRSHRERAQPRERQRLGMLEKHKDYSLRAADYNKKKQQLKNLRQKAADRNEDEFYFGMLSRKGPSGILSKGRRWTGTVDGDRGNKILDVDTVRIMKTQDMGYVRTVRNVLSKEARRLEEQILLAGASLEGPDEEDDSEDDEVARPVAKPRKIVFADNTEEREQIIRDRKPEEKEDVDMESEFEGFGDDAEESPAAVKAKAVRKLQTQLKNARRKLKVLADAEQGLEEQRAKMAKTATSGGFTKKGKKIMVRARKR